MSSDSYSSDTDASNSHQVLLIASHNQGKVREYRQLLADLPLRVISLEDAGIAFDVEETGATFTENARLKAETYAKLGNCWAWADDSGLEVDALNGAPGVYSARYASLGGSQEYSNRTNDLHAANNLKLITELETVPDAERTARFRCVVALAAPDGEIRTCESHVEGTIVNEARGSGGFGYDPHFFLPELGQTMAELSAVQKNQISHRGKAAIIAKQILIKMLAAR